MIEPKGQWTRAIALSREVAELKEKLACVERERDVLRGALTAIADADPPYSISSKGARAILEDADKAREG